MSQILPDRFTPDFLVPPKTSIQPDVEDAKSGDTKTINANIGGVGSMGGTIGNSPITPEATGNWIVFLFLLVLLLGSLRYFFLRYR
jgi:hypothetical protein